MSDQTVSLELRGDADDLIAAVNEAGESMDGLAGQASDAADDIEESISGAGAAFDKYGTMVGGAMTAAGAALEGFNRSQQDTRFVAERVANSIGESSDSIIGLATEVHDATRDLDEMIGMMETGAQQGIDSGQALQDYAVFWDTVGDATGESAGQLASASSALRAVGIAAGEEGRALDAFGFIAQETTGSVGDFLRFLERTGPELGEMNVSVQEAAALMGILEQEFGMSGRTARQEFRTAVGESDGSLSGLLDTLGIGETTFESYTAKVAESSEVINDNAEAFKESRTTLQELQAWLDQTMLKYSGVGEAIEMASGPLMAGGGLVIALNQLKQLSPGLARVGRNATRAAGGLRGLGAAAGALALTAIVYELSGMAKELTTVNTEVERLNSLADDELADTLERMLTRAFTGHAGNPSEAAADFADEMERIARESPAAAESLLALAETADGDLAEAMERAGVDADLMSEAMDRGVAAAERSGEAQERSAEILEDTEGDREDAAGSYADLEASIRGVNDALHAQFDPLFAAQDALIRNADAQDAVKRAELELLRAQDDLNTAIAEHGPKSDEATAASMDLMGAQDALTRANRDATRTALDVATATNELAGKMRDSGWSIEDAESQLRSWVDQGLITEEQAWQTAQELRGTADAARELNGVDPVVTVTADSSDFDATWTRIMRTTSANPSVTITVDGVTNIGFDEGGRVNAPYGAAVPATVHGGEYVIRGEAAKAIGYDTLDALNQGQAIPASSMAAAAPVMAGGGGGNTYRQDITMVVRDPAEAMAEARAAHQRRQLAGM